MKRCLFCVFSASVSYLQTTYVCVHTRTCTHKEANFQCVEIEYLTSFCRQLDCSSWIPGLITYAVY